ncbi:MAG: SprT-like domain-containing protein [Alphaproteobacteria bacterium]|nr:SprT-like domain-containing protein [Alphaproteobacteria bacterium]
MIKHFLKIKKLLNGSVNRHQTKKKTTTVENTQFFKDFLILARSEMDKNNLFDWNLELDFAKVRAGACHFNEKKISFSRNFIKNSSKEDIQDTILHEIAHAIVGPKHGHDKVWKAMASKLGCSAKRCHTLEFSDYKWIRFCANHCWKQKVHRRKSNLICKKCGSPVQYQQNI